MALLLTIKFCNDSCKYNGIYLCNNLPQGDIITACYNRLRIRMNYDTINSYQHAQTFSGNREYRADTNNTDIDSDIEYMANFSFMNFDTQNTNIKILSFWMLDIRWIPVLATASGSACHALICIGEKGFSNKAT